MEQGPDQLPEEEDTMGLMVVEIMIPTLENLEWHLEVRLDWIIWHYLCLFVEKEVRDEAGSRKAL